MTTVLPSSSISIKLLPNGRSGIMLEDYTIWDKDLGVIIVPKGFETDFASVPRLFWNILPPWGEYAPAAIVHDYLYVMQPFTRYEIDYLFLRIMEQLEVGWFKRHIMYRGVRIGGWNAWNRHNEKLNKV